MKLKHGYIQNPESIPAENKGAGWIYFSEDDKAIYLDSGSGPIKFSGTEVDLSDYYNKEEVNEKIPSLDEYVKIEDLPSLDEYAKLEDIPEIPSLDGYATEKFVTEQLENIGPIEGDTSTEKPITVTGVSVGNLSNGFVIPEGTSFTKLLEMMLCKTIGVTSKKPKVSLTGSGLGNTYEVGTVLNLTLGHTYTDGEFVGETGYSYSVNAGCTKGNVNYYKNGSKLDSNTDQITVTSGNTTYKVTVEYKASTVTPVNNMGEPVNISISAGSISSEQSVTGAYKYFMGYSDKTSFEQFNSDDVRELTTKTGFIKGTTTITSSTMTSNGKSIVIACPKNYSLTSIQNGLGANIIDNFECGEVTVKTGAVDTVYKVYVYPITNGAKVEFKNVIVG